jgi:hypothetical protein
MKRVIKQTSFLLLVAFFSFQSWAQDKKVDVDININKKDSSNWYQQPWVWVAGGAVFILLLVAIVRGRGKKE